MTKPNAENATRPEGTVPALVRLSPASLYPFLPAKDRNAPDSELRSLLICYGWEPSKEGAATWLMRIMERLYAADNPPNNLMDGQRKNGAGA